MEWKKTPKKDVDMSKVQSIDNEYTESLKLKKKISDDLTQKMKRRMTLVTVIAVLIFAPMVKGIAENLISLRNVESEIANAKENHTELMATNQDLKVQVGLLQDDEYIAKLARSRYYLSKDGEIIFSLPEDNQSKAANQE